mmetsp:Transcript_23311/g.33271  ORF Transcript_23311/g.33271 Transcript_23311/m.33271 type:complete len:107 (-) Transcript_23311:117-437(-)
MRTNCSAISATTTPIGPFRRIELELHLVAAGSGCSNVWPLSSPQVLISIVSECYKIMCSDEADAFKRQPEPDLLPDISMEYTPETIKQLSTVLYRAVIITSPPITK